MFWILVHIFDPMGNKNLLDDICWRPALCKALGLVLLGGIESGRRARTHCPVILEVLITVWNCGSPAFSRWGPRGPRWEGDTSKAMQLVTCRSDTLTISPEFQCSVSVPGKLVPTDWSGSRVLAGQELGWGNWGKIFTGAKNLSNHTLCKRISCLTIYPNFKWSQDPTLCAWHNLTGLTLIQVLCHAVWTFGSTKWKTSKKMFPWLGEL